MARVKLKCDNTNHEKKILLLKILAENLIYATRIITVQDGFVVLTRSDEDMDKIFQGKTNEELANNSYKPVLPPELKAKRTVL